MEEEKYVNFSFLCEVNQNTLKQITKTTGMLQQNNTDLV